MDAHCEKALLLAQSASYKVILGSKIGINLVGFLFLAFSYCRVVKTQKFAALHVNVRLALHLHAYYIVHVILFIVINNTIDLYRLSVAQADPCNYRLPFWLTYSVRQGYMFGVLGQTLTFVFLSVERIIATFRKGYEHNTSKTFFVLSALLNVVVCFGYAYVYMGYDADWSAQTEFFTQANERNVSRIASFVYIIIACECFSIILYNVTYLLNNRGKNKIRFHEKRITHINMSLTEKYQIDENRKVVGFLLPVCWIHFGIYILSYVGYFLFIQQHYPVRPVQYASLIEVFGFITFYAYIYAFGLLRCFMRKRKAPKEETRATTDEYFNQMDALFRSTKEPRNRRN